MLSYPQEIADLATFTKEILNVKLHFLFIVNKQRLPCEYLNTPDSRKLIPFSKKIFAKSFHTAYSWEKNPSEVFICPREKNF